jgi:hypothetical protein
LIFLDTNVISETLRRNPDEQVITWLAVHDQELAIPTVTIAEIAYGIARIRPDQRSVPLMEGLNAWRGRFAGRIFPFTEQAALIYGDLMGKASLSGAVLSAPDGMIAAITLANRGRLATRNTRDFQGTELELINPWERR